MARRTRHGLWAKAKPKILWPDDAGSFFPAGGGEKGDPLAKSIISCPSPIYWGAFLQDLYARGLTGETLQLVVTDGSPGLHAALDIVYPYVARQRCWVHKLRNVAAQLPRRHQAACLGEVAQIYAAPTERAARQAFRAWATRWRGHAPQAVACLERDLGELLACFTCPPEHRKKIRTTNAIERAFREVRRRVRPMTCFTKPASSDRIVYAVVTHLNTEWERRPLKGFTQKS